MLIPRKIWIGLCSANMTMNNLKSMAEITKNNLPYYLQLTTSVMEKGQQISRFVRGAQTMQKMIFHWKNS